MIDKGEILLRSNNTTKPDIFSRLGTIRKLSVKRDVSIREDLKDNEHFWYLVARAYWDERKKSQNIAKILETSIHREKKEEIRHLSINNAVKTAEQVFDFEKETATDPLTCTFNRRALEKYLSNLLLHPREGETDAIVMMDIDHFKGFNDIYGHPTGDEVLKELVKLIREKIRGIDFLARWGGEEFVLILPGINEDEKSQKAIIDKINDLRENIAQDLKTKIIIPEGKPPIKGVTVSFGLMFSNELKLTQGQNPDLKDFVEFVDRRLCQAKNEGRNKVVGPPNTPPEV